MTREPRNRPKGDIGTGSDVARRLPVGAEVQVAGGVHFRVWAPKASRVAVVLEDGPGSKSNGRFATVELTPEQDGYFSGIAPAAEAGTRHRYRLDGGRETYPDPASRFQPEGPHGPSQVVDPAAFAWTDRDWPGLTLAGQVIYEMHVGTFTPEGTWEAASRELRELAALGVTAIELMPVADFAGRFGWGYDGVDLYAPTRLYGTPDDFRRFVDQAHNLGLGVILDVVYNHMGPSGCYLKHFSDYYFSKRHKTEWGEAINYDGEYSGSVREFFVSNAGYWIDEFHLDGLRIDATQDIYDTSEKHVLEAITRRARQVAEPDGRSVLVIGENEPQQTKLIRPPAQGGFGLDALWNDDFHHSAVVALTGFREAYYCDYRGHPQELVSAAKHGFLFQGQPHVWQQKRRGTPAKDVPPAALVSYLENHDQLANSVRGARIHQRTSPGRYRAMTALLLLGLATPMLFQGQEFAASSPFLYFADHEGTLAEEVARGRAEFLAQFPSMALPETQAVLPDPGDPETFERCKLDLSERSKHSDVYVLHRDLIALKQTDPAFRVGRRGQVDGAVLASEACVIRLFREDGDDRLLVVNLGTQLELRPSPEPLLAPPEEKSWAVLSSSDALRYGGPGTPPLETPEGWHIPGEAAVVLHPVNDFRRS